jgi:hypothetical protein
MGRDYPDSRVVYKGWVLVYIPSTSTMVVEHRESNVCVGCPRRARVTGVVYTTSSQRTLRERERGDTG